MENIKNFSNFHLDKNDNIIIVGLKKYETIELIRDIINYRERKEELEYIKAELEEIPLNILKEWEIKHINKI